MNGRQKDPAARLGLTLLILLSGLALIPFIDLPVEAITWESLAGVYEPDLDVDENSGAPGSVFAFAGSDYPPLSEAAIYVNGSLVGHVMTDGGGMATFKLDTTGAAVGEYNVTLEVDINASATENIKLEAGEPIVMPPPSFQGPAFSILNRTNLPIIFAP